MVDKHSYTPTDDVYLSYKVETCSTNADHDIVSKSQFTRIILSLHPELSVKNKHTENNFIPIYQGLVVLGISEDEKKAKDVEPVVFSIESVQLKIPNNYFIQLCTPRMLHICSMSPYTCNALSVMKEIKFTDNSWSLTIGGKAVDLKTLDIDDRFASTLFSISLIFSIVDKLEICRGRKLLKPVVGGKASRSFVTEHWCLVSNENANDTRTRAKGCHRVLPITGRSEACRACQKLQEVKCEVVTQTSHLVSCL